ncbi:hypothetical protein DSECCO2_662430 [anaerobic digester metagenome]
MGEISQSLLGGTVAAKHAANLLPEYALNAVSVKAGTVESGQKTMKDIGVYCKGNFVPSIPQVGDSSSSIVVHDGMAFTKAGAFSKLSKK